MIFAGLDIETTGSSHEEHQLIQIGIALPSLDGPVPFYASRDVGWGWGDYSLTSEAMKVNRFTTERIEGGLRPAIADASLCDWLDSYGIKPHSLMAVGWNVGSFDLPFVRKTLPHLMSYFHKYRAADLNSACFLLGGEKWEAWKKQAKRFAVDVLGSAEWHDAGFDAAAGLLAWEWLRLKIQEPEKLGKMA